MNEKKAVIFGAGKIARGFIAHLLVLSGFEITFVEKSRELVALLHQRKRYKVHIMGAPEKSICIEGFDVVSSGDAEAVAERVAEAGVIFVSIGGPNLPQIAPLLAAGIRCAEERGRAAPLNIILCENYFQPGAWLRKMIVELVTPETRDWFQQHVGVVETMVLRSSVEPTQEMKADDPLSVKAQDMWEMPADKEAFIGAVPPIRGLVPKEKFQAALTRKLYTYNAINAVFAYQGYLRGYQFLSEAANDPELIREAKASSREAGEALCKRFGFDPDEQRQFAGSAIAKYQKREIVDPVERNARDPVRKLSRNDRLVGPACLALEEGIRPAALSRAIAAGLLYDNPGDPAARKIQALIQNSGLAAALREVCGITDHDDLAKLVGEAYSQLRKQKRGVLQEALRNA
jgi:mannitol-1-phosphate 5-dehydrogenase